MEQGTQNFNATDEQIIVDNEKWFSFFVYLPKIVTIIFALATVIGGLVGCATGGAGIGIGILFGGGVLCGITYALMKISLSYQILHIYYLKKVASEAKVSNKGQKEDNESLPKI